MDAFGIFEGGGAKGLAHIGALKAAETYRIRFLGVAGTSAGSIVAALAAAGYRADELFSENNSQGVLDINFTDFFYPDDWKEVKALRAEFTKWSSGKMPSILRCCFALRAHSARLKKISQRGGLLNGDKFTGWLNAVILKKLVDSGNLSQPKRPDGHVSFAEVPTPLVVIAADVTNRATKVFSRTKTPTESIAEAVAGSISIPLIFSPRPIGASLHVDGGILSNFPAWVFDDERDTAPPLTPTIGFRLGARPLPTPPPGVSAQDLQNGKPAFAFGSYFKSLASLALFGDSTLESRRVRDLHQIKLGVGLNVLQFDASREEKLHAIRDGEMDAGSYLHQASLGAGPSTETMNRHLRTIRHAVINELKVRFNKAASHLRLNVMRPIEKDLLQIVYSFGMEDDADDRMKLKKGSGASGQCWVELKTVVADLKSADASYKDDWQLSKYDQALVRSSLVSLLCIPLFDRRRLERNEGSLNDAFLGILNIDSDENLLEEFAHLTVEETTCKEWSYLVSDQLIHVRE